MYPNGRTEMTTYTRPDGAEYSEQDAARIEETRERLLSGRTFSMSAAGYRSAYGYRPPCGRDQYAHVVQTLGRMAAQSDSFAQIAAAILNGGLNPYGNRDELAAKVYEGAAKALASGYDDVIKRASPEPGRYSDAQRGYSLGECILLDYWLAEATAKCASHLPGVGWCVDALARAERVHVNSALYPSLTGLRKREEVVTG
jgi:hypothetical protein